MPRAESPASPVAEIDATLAASDPGSKFKLKPRTDAASSLPPPPFPVAAPAAEVPDPNPVTPRLAGESVEPKQIAKGKRTVFLVAGTLGLVVLAVGFYFTYAHFLTPEPPPPPPAKKAPVATTAPKVAPVVPVTKAKAVIDSRAQAAGETAAPIAAAAPSPAPSPAAPQPSAAPAKAPAAAAPAPATEPATARTTIAKGVTATTTLEQAGADASVEFRTFVANAKVSGVFQGTPARAFINGRLARAGETIDATLGIAFERIDADKRHIIFRDRTGATVTRRY